jgi:hypothetical protein
VLRSVSFYVLAKIFPGTDALILAAAVITLITPVPAAAVAGGKHLARAPERRPCHVKEVLHKDGCEGGGSSPAAPSPASYPALSQPASNPAPLLSAPAPPPPAAGASATAPLIPPLKPPPPLPPPFFFVLPISPFCFLLPLPSTRSTLPSSSLSPSRP